MPYLADVISAKHLRPFAIKHLRYHVESCGFAMGSVGGTERFFTRRGFEKACADYAAEGCAMAPPSADGFSRSMIRKPHGMPPEAERVYDWFAPILAGPWTL